MVSTGKYSQFKHLLNEFVTQANLNIQDESKRNPGLNSSTFEFNDFQRKGTTDIIKIEDTKYYSILFRNGSYGPTKGEGSFKIPFIGYELTNGNWVNIRTVFKNHHMESLEFVIWDQHSGEDKKTGITYKVADLGLDLEEPNELLKELLDKYLLLKTKNEGDTKTVGNHYISEYAEKLKHSKNIILRGAPGTGKTYLAQQIASLLIGEEDEKKLNESEQYGFVQFHPSYDYTDFVEGLRPVIEDDQENISFQLVDGIFKEFCERAKSSEMVDQVDNFDDAWDELIRAINESEKDYLMDRSTVPATVNSNHSIKFRTPVATKEKVYKLYRGENTQLKYETYHKIVLEHLKDEYNLKPFEKGISKKQENKNYVFLIDEINRGEISKIFGELFFSIDPGYRGQEEYGISTQYSNLHIDAAEKFYIPDNVYIIGTMNDIDRSVDSFDFAMRRRFRFIEVKAQDMIHMWDGILDKEKIGEAKKRLFSLNKQISNTEGLNDNYHIGPSYFLKLPELGYNYDILWTDYIQPLLEEYLRGSYEEKERLENMENAFYLKKEDGENDKEVEKEVSDET